MGVGFWRGDWVLGCNLLFSFFSTRISQVPGILSLKFYCPQLLKGIVVQLLIVYYVMLCLWLQLFLNLRNFSDIFLHMIVVNWQIT